MKILHTVALYDPSVGGVQEVVKQISRRLVLSGHEVTVATRRLPERTRAEIDGVRVESFDVTGSAVHGIAGEAKRYQEFLRNGNFDVMMNYAAQQWATDLALPILDELPFAKVLAPCGFSGLFMPDYAGYFRALPAALARYDRLVLHSGTYRDATFARDHGLVNVTVIPNAAGEDEFEAPAEDFRARYGISAESSIILSVGTHTGSKGHALVLEAFRRARVGSAVLVLIGNAIGPNCLSRCRAAALRARALSLGRKRVLLLDPPRRDVVGAYHAADVLLSGSSLECSPLVLFEAMASRTPFIALAAGNAEEIVDWGGGGVVVASERRADGAVFAQPDAVARQLEAVLGNPGTMSTLADSGYRAWRERFTWEAVVPKYEALYYSLAPHHQPAAPGSQA